MRVAGGGQWYSHWAFALPGNVVHTRQDDNLSLQFAKL
jgi:hypothetical protein